MREVVMNNKTNLLKLEERFYQLADVTEPNTFRSLFPYDEIPKIAFNDRIVPHDMPEEIWITDTTFRDGQQSRAPYTTEQIVTIYDYFHRLGGPNGKIKQSEFFLYSKKDRDAVYKCMERGYEFPEVTAWIRASQQDFNLFRGRFLILLQFFHDMLLSRIILTSLPFFCVDCKGINILFTI